MSPVRVQRRRTKGWRMPEGAKYVGRPSNWGNPFAVGETYLWLPELDWPIPSFREPGIYDHGIVVERCETRLAAAEWFKLWAEPNFTAEIRVALAGHDLACWCPLDEPCHADVLLELANGGAS